MNGSNYKDYFVQPADSLQRRYEALRAVVVEEQPMQQVAERFDVGYGTVRNWVSEFRRGWDAGQSPPFSLRPRVEVRSPTRRRTATNRRFKLPTSKRCRWKQDGG